MAHFRLALEDGSGVVLLEKTRLVLESDGTSLILLEDGSGGELTEQPRLALEDGTGVIAPEVGDGGLWLERGDFGNPLLLEDNSGWLVLEDRSGYIATQGTVYEPDDAILVADVLMGDEELFGPRCSIGVG